MNSIHNKSPISSSVDLAIFHRIDINLYPLFIAIYEQRSISKAAQILCISQSAASHALQRLRQHLQDDLFVRAGSKMLPTPFAEQIYPVIKNALIAIQAISIRSEERRVGKECRYQRSADHYRTTIYLVKREY